eukprot:TRINITY_DN40624_c0_g1_i1.p1 TRINITY_DN40624_c0_g1~~TRINITY_DN40624_c0_g1_i1.p1  ORF type:complete len:214 (+),score=36.84 TRINITY_DN40624_c0_g1_i1:27-644(+)
MAVRLLLPIPALHHQRPIPAHAASEPTLLQAFGCKELLVIIFGTPSIAGGGNNAELSHHWQETFSPGESLNKLRELLRQWAPSSRSWAFDEDPVPALAGRDSRAVMADVLPKRDSRTIRFFKWLQPEMYEKAKGFIRQAVDVSSTLEPLLPMAPKVHPPPRSAADTRPNGNEGGSGVRFDASVHPQLNYTEALCRKLLCPGSRFG